MIYTSDYVAKHEGTESCDNDSANGIDKKKDYDNIIRVNFKDEVRG